MNLHHPWNDDLARDLNRQFGDAPAVEIMEFMIERISPRRIAVVSSFGAESAVMVHLVAEIDPSVPVIFLDTGKLFPETLQYRDRLVERLGLSNVRTVRPAADDLMAHDEEGTLWSDTPNRCCFFRKVRPLRRALEGFDAWFTGRKRHHGIGREDLPVFEVRDGRVKVNPLAHWTKDAVQAYLDAHQLPRHPLEAAGFHSIGCEPCTGPAQPGEDIRAGRWRGSSKTECGIHLPALAHTHRNMR